MGTVAIGFKVMTGQLRSGLNSAGSVLTSMTSSWANLGGAVTAVQGAFGLLSGAARGASGLISELVMSASDLEESLNLVRVQFGSGAPEIESAAQRMADKFGIVKSEFLQGAGSIGVVVEAMGEGAETTAYMSAQLVELAADLSSIRNIRFEDVMVGLRAGLGGESEPLKNLGVFINEAIVKQEAYRAGIAKVGAELTDAQKIQARYNLIFQQTTKAQGDLERTATGVANSIRSVGGRIENLKADIGGAFTSVTQVALASVLDVLGQMTGGFGQVRESVKAWADASVLYGGIVNQAVGFVGEALARLVDGVNTVRVAFRTSQAAITQVVAFAVRGVIAWIRLLDEGLKKSQKVITALSIVNPGAAGGVKLGAAIAKAFAGDGGPSLIDQAETFAASLDDAAKSQWDAVDAIRAQAGAGDRVRSVTAQIQARMNELGVAAQTAAAPLVDSTAKAAENVEKAAKLQFSGALEFGSAEARTAILSARFSGGDTAAKEQVTLAKQQVSLTQQTVNELRLLTKALTFQVADI